MAESLFQAGTGLPKNPPRALDGMPAARAAWRGLIRAFAEVGADLLSGLDREFLISYCQAVQANRDAFELARSVKTKYDKGEAALQDVLKARAELRMATRLLLDFSKQLYTSPKSRGGVQPPQKEPENPMAAAFQAAKKLLEEGDE